MITRAHTQELLSKAYVYALAGMAGLKVRVPEMDYGIDGQFRTVKDVGGELVPSGPPVEFQLKATTRWSHKDGFVVYDLEARAHRILSADREPGEPMAILILLCLPETQDAWLDSLEERLHLQHCCYWFLPEGPPTENSSSVRVKVPRANLLTPAALKSVMELAREKALAT